MMNDEKIVLDIRSCIYAHTMERMLMQKLDDCQIVISELPDANRRVVQNASARCALKCNISKPPFCAAGPKITGLPCSPAQLLSKE